MEAYRELKKLIEPNFPGLLDTIQNKIKTAEINYEKCRENNRDSLLWEHSVIAAFFALKICLIENQDPLFPVVAALFHDIGKFEGGQYQKNTIPEEKTSARIASEILTTFGLRSLDINCITSGLTALYDERTENNTITDIVHDADFLSKTGYLGVANFFMKAAKRGLNLNSALAQNLSKELTYASVLPRNMRTTAGKKLAKKKSQELRLFFEGLLQELRDLNIARFETREEILPCPQETDEELKFILVLPESCPSCTGKMKPEYSFVQGIKCTELVAKISCAHCPSTICVSFCLPEITGHV